MCGLKVGDNITINARVLPEAKWFEIGFANSAEDVTTRALLLRAETEGKTVAAKRYGDGAWVNYEAAEQSSEYPFENGQDFTMELLVEDKAVDVSVNGKHFKKFTFYLPVEDVRYINLYGGLQPYTVLVKGTSVFYLSPNQTVLRHKMITDADEYVKFTSTDVLSYTAAVVDEHSLVNYVSSQDNFPGTNFEFHFLSEKTAPIIEEIPDNYDTVTIHGRIGSEFRYAEISLAKDVEGTARPILFHIEGKSIYAKYYHDAAWVNYEDAEQSKEFPLENDKPFEFKIKKHENNYHVSINGRPFHVYPIHLDHELGKYAHVYGAGDFTVHLMSFEKH